MFKQTLTLLAILASIFQYILVNLVPLITLYIFYKLLTKKRQQKTRRQRRNQFLWFFYEENSPKNEKGSFWHLTLIPLIYFLIQQLSFPSLVFELTLKLLLLSLAISLVAKLLVGDEGE